MEVENRKNRIPLWEVACLSVTNACFMSTIFAFVFLAGIMGEQIAANSSFSTLPITSYVLGAALSIMPVSMLMESKGRRIGFLVGAGAGIFSGLLVFLAWHAGSFAVLCSAGFFVGVLTACSGFLRFAALEITAVESRGAAASIVLCGGIVAALFGTQMPLALADITVLELYPALGLSLIIVNIVAVFFALNTPKKASINSNTTRGVAETAKPAAMINFTHFKNRNFARGVAACAGGYALMTLLMNAAPLYIKTVLEMPLETVEFVMRNHFLSMFIPFLFSGVLMDKIGINRILMLGTFLNAVSIGTLIFGSSLPHLAVGFVLLGTAWNFLYLGGTALVFNSIDENQAHAGQRANEISVDVGNLIASASVGFLIYQVGMISVFIFSTVLCVFIAIMIFRKMEV